MRLSADTKEKSINEEKADFENTTVCDLHRWDSLPWSTRGVTQLFLTVLDWEETNDEKRNNR